MIIIASLIFIAGYALITLEHRWNLSKAVTAVAMGALLWLIIAIRDGHAVEHFTAEMGSEIFGLVAFLLAAMTLVEILVHYQFFDLIRMKLLRLGLDDVKQLWLMGIIAFFLSAVIDNLTTTIVMVQISRRFFRGENLLIAAASIVIAANAGGAFSPIGDVTTIMLWLAKKFTAIEVILWGFLPSLALFFVSFYLMAIKLGRDTKDLVEESVALTGSEKIVISSAFAAFPMPLIFHLLGLQPYFGLLMGLGITGLIIAVFKNKLSERTTHLEADIEKLLKGVDFASLLFFTGILLAVGALRYLGILSAISNSVFGEAPELWRLVAGNTFLGIFSAIVDNIPLTAAAIDILNTSDPALWVLLALTVGTGGSMLVIGSAAGVVAMGMVKELTFKKYMQIATVPAAVGYFVAIFVWYLQYMIVR